MRVEAPIVVEAEVLHRPMRAGRNQAVLLGCRTGGGDLVDCVVKLADCLGGVAPVPYLAEWFAAALGRQLGIDVAEPYEVHITPDFAASLEPPWDERAKRSLGSAFGSGFRTGPLQQWTPNQLVPLEIRAAAIELLAFDILIHNPDRRRTNPNLFVSRATVFAFDHGDAFSFLWPLIGAPDPAEDPLLLVADDHVFGVGLGRKIPSLAGFRARVEALTDEDLDEIVRLTPTAWQGGLAAGKLDKIREVLRRRRDAIGKWLPLVEARVDR